LFVAKERGSLDLVGLGNLVMRIGHGFGECRVVGHQQKAAGIQIEPPNRKQPCPGAADKIVDRRAAFRISRRSQVPLGLVQQDVGFGGRLERLSVERNAVPFQVHPLVRIPNGFSVHAHASGANPTACVGPRTQTGL